MPGIAALTASEILDSRGNPTIRVYLRTDDGSLAVASVPSRASTGEFEAHELRDGDKTRYSGRGVLKAVANVGETIAPALIGLDPTRQAEIDQLLIDVDASPDKSNLGANAILGVSMAVACAGAAISGKPLYAYLGGADASRLPVPMNVINGGRHAQNSLDFQEFMLVPHGAPTFGEALRDDLYATNTDFIARGIREASTNAVLIKLNQIGTVTETIRAIEVCRQAGWNYVVSHRSGETEDTFIADFTVAMGGGQLKTGSLCRSERVAKYNRLLEIERELGDKAMFVDPFVSGTKTGAQ